MPPPPTLAARTAPPPATTTLPVCLTGCLAFGNATGCGGYADLACLCRSPDYLPSVQPCLLTVCLGDDYRFAVKYTERLCAEVAGTLLTTVTSGGLPAVATNSYLPPVVLSRAVGNIQAIMSSICSLLLVFALALGFMSCRRQARRAAQHAAASAWSIGSATRHATHGSMSRPAAAHFASHSRARSRGGGGGAGDESFIGMESFFLGRPSGIGEPLPAPVPAKKKFTNRMTPDEWEMAEREDAAGAEEFASSEPPPASVSRRRDVQWEDETYNSHDDDDDDHDDEPPLSSASHFTNRLSARTQAAADADAASILSSYASHEVFVARRVGLGSPRPGDSPPPSAASTGFTDPRGGSHTLWDNDSGLESDFAVGSAFLAERRRSALEKGKGRAE